MFNTLKYNQKTEQERQIYNVIIVLIGCHRIKQCKINIPKNREGYNYLKFKNQKIFKYSFT